MVNCLVQIARGEGYRVSVYPEYDSGSDIVVFRHWSGMTNPAKEIRRINPEIDILYGQDLCHQVPAVVRWSE